jgi:hypothetical protein
MTLLVPTVGDSAALAKILNQDLTMKLFSNDIIPAKGDTASSYTEVSGGGYLAKTLVFAGWTIADGIATYTFRDFLFTGAIAAPTTVFGYFIVTASDVLIVAERCPEAILPFSPKKNTIVRITPRLEAD